MADDSLRKQLERMAAQGMPMDDTTDKMTELIQPEEMQRNLAQQDEADDLARRIQKRMSAKQMAGSEADAASDFARKYADKMKAPAGMIPESIGDETARLGMKVPKEIRKGALAKLAGKAGKVLGPAAGIAGMLMQDELNPEGQDVENPDLPMEERVAAARAGEAQMREENAEEQEFAKLDKARRARMEALMERLRAESGEE